MAAPSVKSTGERGERGAKGEAESELFTLASSPLVPENLLLALCSRGTNSAFSFIVIDHIFFSFILHECVCVHYCTTERWTCPSFLLYINFAVAEYSQQFKMFYLVLSILFLCLLYFGSCCCFLLWTLWMKLLRPFLGLI